MALPQRAGTTIGSVYAAPAIGPDGAIYIGDRSGQVFKFPGGAFPAGAPPTPGQRVARLPARHVASPATAATTPGRDPQRHHRGTVPDDGGSNSYGYAINAAGAAAGMADGHPAYPNNWGFAYNGAYWAASSTSPTLDYPYGWNSTYYVTAGINSGGDIVGYNGNNAYVRYVNNSGANLPSLNSSASQAYGISADRTIASATPAATPRSGPTGMVQLFGPEPLQSRRGSARRFRPTPTAWTTWPGWWARARPRPRDHASGLRPVPPSPAHPTPTWGHSAGPAPDTQRRVEHLRRRICRRLLHGVETVRPTPTGLPCSTYQLYGLAGPREPWAATTARPMA
jgi:hypothetical protein